MVEDFVRSCSSMLRIQALCGRSAYCARRIGARASGASRVHEAASGAVCHGMSGCPDRGRPRRFGNAARCRTRCRELIDDPPDIPRSRTFVSPDGVLIGPPGARGQVRNAPWSTGSRGARRQQGPSRSTKPRACSSWSFPSVSSVPRPASCAMRRSGRAPAAGQRVQHRGGGRAEQVPRQHRSVLAPARARPPPDRPVRSRRPRRSPGAPRPAAVRAPPRRGRDVHRAGHAHRAAGPGRGPGAR